MRWIVRNILGQAFVLTCLLLAIPASGWTRNGVLIMGDSLSAAHNIPADKGWVSLLEQRLKREMASPPEITNASISGETSSGALTRLPELLRRHQPAVVVIELGGNDALRGLQLSQLRGNLERMIVLSQAANARVLLLGIDVPPNYGPAYRQRLRKIYVDLAEQYDTAVVPFFLEGVALRPDLMQTDGVHPTAAAQSKILDNIWPVLRPLL